MSSSQSFASKLKAKARSMISHPFWPPFFAWTTLNLVLSVAMGSIVPALVIRNEHTYFKYCTSLQCPPYPLSNPRTFILSNFHAHMLGTALLIVPSGIANDVSEYLSRQQALETLAQLSTLWIVMATSMPIGSCILNSVSLDGVRMNPGKVLMLTVPGGLCEVLAAVPVGITIAFLVEMFQSWKRRTWRICGSGKSVV